jgi:DNA endonuclease activator SAE2/CtIP C-terminus
LNLRVESLQSTSAQSSAPASASPSDAITGTRPTPRLSTPTAFPSELTGAPEHKGAISGIYAFFLLDLTYPWASTGDAYIGTLKSRLGLLSIEGNLTSLTPKTRSELPANLKRPRANEPISEPRPARKRRISKSVLDDSPAGGEDCLDTYTEEPTGRPSNVIVRTMKNDSRTRLDIERSHSSPPDSPHRASKTRSIEDRVTPLRREATSDGIGLGKDNSFAGPSRPEAQIMTKEEREAHFKQLRSKPHAEYKKAYEAYKGHGRYGQRPTGCVILSGWLSPGRLLIFTRREDEDDDINSAYELDETRNDGMSRPFDEVVRNKEARQRLHGIDCSCCKAVGAIAIDPESIGF